MAIIKSGQAEQEAVRAAAVLMAAGARTAPKARGIDDIETLIIEGDDLEKLATTMEIEAQGKPPFISNSVKRDANSVRKSNGVLLVGVKGYPKKIEQPLDCGWCGYGSCQGLANARKRAKDSRIPNCIFQAMDLGIALGAAVKMASEFNMDNRMMRSIGAAAIKMGLLESDIIIGIPLSVTGKNPYFDRQ